MKILKLLEKKSFYGSYIKDKYFRVKNKIEMPQLWSWISLDSKSRVITKDEYIQITQKKNYEKTL